MGGNLKLLRLIGNRLLQPRGVRSLPAQPADHPPRPAPHLAACRGGARVGAGALDDFQFDRPDGQRVAGRERRFVERSIIEQRIRVESSHHRVGGAAENHAVQWFNAGRSQAECANRR
jgi:hypothetical protein